MNNFFYFISKNEKTVPEKQRYTLQICPNVALIGHYRLAPSHLWRHPAIAINSHISRTEQDTMKLFAATCVLFVALSYVPN